MKLLFFSPYYLPHLSGLTLFPAQILAHWAKKHHVRVLTFRHQPHLSPRETKHQLTIFRFSPGIRLSKGFISPASWFSFFPHFFWADLVIINLPNLEGLPLALMARLFHKPLLAFFHCEVNLGSGTINHLISFCLSQSLKLQLNLSNQIITTTLDYPQHLSWYSTTFLKKTQSIFPPIRSLLKNPQIQHHYRQLKQNHYWLGFSGRLAREKGLEYLIAALEKLTLPRPFTLVLAGPSGKQVTGESSYTSFIQSRLKQASVPHLFLGSLSPADLSAFYANLNVLVLPSINQTEAFGMVQVEAMLAGVPVVASNLPGVRVPLQQTGMGLLVKPKDVTGLRSALHQVLTSPHLYTNPTNQAKTRRLFQPQPTFVHYDKLLNQFK